MKNTKHLLLVLFFIFTCISATLAADKLRWIENKGQWHENVKYKMQLAVGDVYLEANKMKYAFWEVSEWADVHTDGDNDKPHGRPVGYKGHAYQVSFVGANPQTQLQSFKKLQEYHNYYIGNDPTKWAASVNIYEEVKYKTLYPGIDMHVYAHEGYMKYDFLVEKGKSPSVIQLKYEGQNKIEIAGGNLLISNDINQVKELAPVAYQVINGKKMDVPCTFHLSENIVTFDFPSGYNLNYALVIDPTLVFSTPTGSSASNYGFTATYDNAGNAFGGGNIFGPGYPVTIGAFQTTFMGGSTDAGITKYNPTGTAAIFSTYLGGNGFDAPHSMIVNSLGELLVMGSTGSSNFPIVGGFDNTLGGTADFYVAKFSVTGALLASTFIGGSGDDGRNTGFSSNYGDASRGEIVVDDQDNVYVAGCSNSTDFPTTLGAYDVSHNGSQDGVVFKINPTLSSLTWATYLGTTADEGAFGVKVDDIYNVYVSGGTSSATFPTTTGTVQTASSGAKEGFVSKLSANGANLLASTYTGTTGNDVCFFLELNAANEVFVMGQTDGNYPIINTTYSMPNGNLFIAKLNNNLTTYLFTTRVATNVSSGNMSPTAFLVDVCENVYFCGWGTTTGLPVSANAVQPTSYGGDFYLGVLEPGATGLLHATNFGGTSWEHVDGGTSRFDKNGIVYEAVCSSGNFPITPGAFSSALGSGFNLSVFKIAFGFSGTTASFNPTDSLGIAVDTVCGSFHFYYQNNSTHTPTTAYIWDFGDGTPIDTTYIPSHYYNTPGDYTITLIVTDTAASCTGSDTTTQTITVLAPPIADFNATDVCVGQVTQFTNQTNVPCTAYIWIFGNGIGSSALENPSYNYSSAGTYNVNLIVQTGVGCADTVMHPIQVFEGITASFTAPPVCQNNPSIFTNTSTLASGTFTSSWDLGNGTSSTVTNPSPIYVNAGTYNATLIVTTDHACKDTVTQALIVYPTPIADFTTADVCLTKTAQFTNQTNIPCTNFLWGFGDGMGTSLLQNPSYTYSTAGNYMVSFEVTTADGCKDTILHPIEIFEGISANFSAPPVCHPNTSVFTNNSVLASGTFTSSWNMGDGFTSTATNLNHTYLNPGTYNATLVVTTDHACKDSLTQSVIVYPKPTADFLAPPVCQNLPSVFADNSTLASQWNWDLADGTTNSTSNFNHIYASPNTYQVQLIVTTVEGCKDTIIKPVTVYALPKADFMAANKCEYDAVNYVNTSTLGSHPMSSYAWDFGDASTATIKSPSHLFATFGNYLTTLIATDDFGCADTIQKNIEIYAKPNADFVVPTVCFGTESNFLDNSAMPSNSADVLATWNWSFGDGNSSNNQNPIHNYAFADNFPVILTVTSDKNCVDAVSHMAIVKSTPLVPIIKNDTVCAGTDAILLAGTVEDAWIYWYSNYSDSLPFYTGFEYQLSPLFTYHSYYVQAIDKANGCRSVKIPIIADVHPETTQEIVINPTELFVPNAVANFSVSTNIPLIDYSWTLENRITSEAATPIHQYQFPGVYDIEVNTTDKNGCKKTLTQQIEVKEVKGLQIPSVFSPNGDLSNDDFWIGNYEIAQFSIEIYNRWGEMIFASADPNFRWNGKTQNGKDCPEGVYVYKIKARSTNLKDIAAAGTITLIR